ncbi:hypothetical protein ACKKBG_A32680 [Auxenochlorella protothecoides x Auxenochlorella symbiontica]
MADKQDCQEEVDRFLGDLSWALDAADEARVLSMLRSLVPRPPMLGDAVVQGMDLLIRAGLTHASSLQLVADVWDRAAQHCGARDLIPIFLAATGTLAGERGDDPQDPGVLLLTHALRALGTLAPRVHRGGTWVARDVAALVTRLLQDCGPLPLPALEACEGVLSGARRATASGPCDLQTELALAGAALTHHTLRGLPSPAGAAGPVAPEYWAEALSAAWGGDHTNLLARLLQDPPGGLPALVSLSISEMSGSRRRSGDAGAAVILALSSRLFGRIAGPPTYDSTVISFDTVLAAAARLLRPGCGAGLLALACLALARAVAGKGKAADVPWGGTQDGWAVACITALHSPMAPALAPPAAHASRSLWCCIPQPHQEPVLRRLLRQDAPPEAVRGGLTLLSSAEHPSLLPLALTTATNASLTEAFSEEPCTWLELATLQASLLLRQALRVGRGSRPEGPTLDPGAARRHIAHLRRRAAGPQGKGGRLPLDRLHATLDWALEALARPQA